MAGREGADEHPGLLWHRADANGAEHAARGELQQRYLVEDSGDGNVAIEPLSKATSFGIWRGRESKGGDVGS